MIATNTTCTFRIDDFNEVKEKMLNWLSQFSIFCFLDNHGYNLPHSSHECLVAVGANRIFESSSTNAIPRFQSFIDQSGSWLFGHLGYELRNEIGGLPHPRENRLKFPLIFFFEPKLIIRLNRNEMILTGEEGENAYEQIMASRVLKRKQQKTNLSQRIKREEYVEIIKRIKANILRGDCYELNYCMEFFSEGGEFDPLTAFADMGEFSANPFSAFYRVNDKYLVCGSPERWLRKTGDHIISQPMKGTSPRYDEASSDEKSRQQLGLSGKDRAENVMIVDLVRNDLSMVCEKGSVDVEELFGIYSFPHVHQMVSTIGGDLRKDVSFTDIIRACFPMGSMTGAPKKRVMELIDEYEKDARGIFSGALGYIDPKGDFDFNVVIRSIMYNSSERYLSFRVGSGITFNSDPDLEYEECLVKASGMRKVL